ncbi:hypothetical protein KSF_007140 [Reticulibacter mediterranei]|uniref:DUF4386 domain-containing protein n=1 Tax=Reticulibacter mediterranei TaxID=2778369 RepID=A0A8J3IJ92_9CHLR|nr:DUF4386 domain-containing protein [Reticulibacter mediterranei]GHO90666.1 hypothetical protein KSF_007140 [Reticulibacter mediterranei]
MNITTQTTSMEGDKHVHAARQTATIVGVLFILAAVTAILGLIFYSPILGGPDYLRHGAEHKDQIILGALMELLVVCSAIGTAVGLFPFLRKYNESIALGYLCFRLLETVLITIGLISILSLLTLSQSFVATAPNASAFQASGILLLAIHDWTFKIGPDFMLGINTTMYSYLLYRSRLVPRWIAIMGLTGATLVLLAALLEMFGIILQISLWGIILALPVATYEMTLAVWLIVKGFNPDAIASKSTD